MFFLLLSRQVVVILSDSKTFDNFSSLEISGRAIKTKIILMKSTYFLKGVDILGVVLMDI